MFYRAINEIQGGFFSRIVPAMSSDPPEMVAFLVERLFEVAEEVWDLAFCLKKSPDVVPEDSQECADCECK